MRRSAPCSSGRAGRGALLCVLLGLAAPAAPWVLYSPIKRLLPPPRTYEDGFGVAWTPGVTGAPPPFDLGSVAYRWSLPPSSTSDDGLGSGISWALHRDFCAHMLRRFPEEDEQAKLFGPAFIRCDDLRDTIARSMNTWTINHKQLYFTDVTDSCADAAGAACAAAELFIVPDVVVPDSAATTKDLAAYVSADRTTIDYVPWSTAGNQQASGLGMRRALLLVDSTDICWCSTAPQPPLSRPLPYPACLLLPYCCPA